MKKRYFLVSFSYLLCETTTFTGNLWINQDSFPTEKQITDIIKNSLFNSQVYNYSQIIILGISEFKEKDYNTFLSDRATINGREWIINKIKEIKKEYQFDLIRYEYRVTEKNIFHIIEVNNIAQSLISKFIVAAEKIKDNFKELFPDEDILFVNKFSKVTINNVNFSI